MENDRPWPMPYRLQNKTYHGDDFEEMIEPERIAYWAHCEAAMEPEALLEWLRGELEHLNGIDPYCDK